MVEPVGVKPRSPPQKNLRRFYAWALFKHDGEWVSVKLTCRGKEIVSEQILDHDASPRPPRSAMLRSMEVAFFQGETPGGGMVPP